MHEQCVEYTGYGTVYTEYSTVQYTVQYTVHTAHAFLLSENSRNQPSGKEVIQEKVLPAHC